jgi:hypothetical protein
MKKYRYILILFFFPIILFGQKRENFNKLIEKLNHCLLEYNKLTPFGGSDNYYSINGFGLSKQEIKDLIADIDYGGIFSANKDSIEGYYLIDFFRGEIESYLDKVIKHTDFLKNNITNLLKGDVLSIVKSDDNKLLNVSFDDKMGGTYRSQVSRMYYINTETAEVIDLNQTDNSIFASNGYNAIYTIQTIEGTKYVLTGYVRGCSYCFETFVQLIKSSENEFIEEFMYSVNSRNWNDSVTYVHDEKAIYVDYHINDLTPSCDCSEYVFNYEDQKNINCKSKFIFDGKNFELVEVHWKIIDNKNIE